MGSHLTVKYELSVKTGYGRGYGGATELYGSFKRAVPRGSLRNTALEDSMCPWRTLTRSVPNVPPVGHIVLMHSGRSML